MHRYWTWVKQKWQSEVNRPASLRIAIVVLLVVIAVMFALWRPWDDTNNDQYVEVNGHATLTAVPDQSVFRSSYQITDTNWRVASDKAEIRRQEIIAGLEELGISLRNIKTSTSGYDRPHVSMRVYNLDLRVMVDDEERVEAVRNYLLSEEPTGEVSQSWYLSEQKWDELLAQARDIAIKDARANAEQSLQALGRRVGKVRRVYDYYAFGLAPEWDTLRTGEPQQALLPGENEINYKIKVRFFIR